MKIDDRLVRMAAKYELKIYTAQPMEDVWIANWHSELVQSQELEKIFFDKPYSLSSLYRIFAPPRSLFYGLDYAEEVISFAMWLEPSYFGAFFGMWIHPRRRYSPRHFRRFQVAMAMAMEFYPLLIAVTMQEHLTDSLHRLGFDRIGIIKNFVDGKPGWLFTMDRSRFSTSILNPFCPVRRKEVA